MIYFLLFSLGLLIGSFLNVCIYRIPKNQTVVTTPSHCPKCNYRIKWYDLIPVFSYLFLGGKCRFCKEKVSIQYPSVELLNGSIYVWLYFIYSLSVQFFGMAFLASTLIVISFIDFKYSIIPNRIILVLLIGGIIYNILDKELTYVDSIAGFFAASFPLLVIAVLSKGGMGGGDVKLMAVAGIFLGWQLILLALFLASMIGSVVGIALIVLKIKKRKDLIPFGPFLAAGIFIVMLYGHEIIKWYLGFYT
ncbi:MAG: leader peptidase (prepilin peptidase) / N-methyltransferase [Clostridiales bacterium]|nr:leader peptidase (prepilin peptidase) / N-methyltransferase [Clostridiales bacterium]MDK2934341.1 leader peptidase (prepilin peptidase) / N-methyltransferase [Clostridiales bacterium]